jgi:hypothetical protein
VTGFHRRLLFENDLLCTLALASFGAPSDARK